MKEQRFFFSSGVAFQVLIKIIVGQRFLKILLQGRIEIEFSIAYRIYGDITGREMMSNEALSPPL
jgi:hypothetical protein